MIRLSRGAKSVAGGPVVIPEGTDHLVRCFPKNGWVTTSQEGEWSSTRHLVTSAPGQIRRPTMVPLSSQATVATTLLLLHNTGDFPKQPGLMAKSSQEKSTVPPAKFFEGVHAFATAGGRDEAHLHGSDGDDRFVAEPTQAAVFRSGEFYNRAKFFEEVYGYAGQGENDRAELRDSKLADLLEADADGVRLSNEALDFLYQAKDFDHVTAKSTGGADKRSIAGPIFSYDLELLGPWQDL